MYFVYHVCFLYMVNCMKKDYWKNLTSEEKKKLASDLSVAVDYLRQVFLYDVQLSGARARELAGITGIGAHEFCDVFEPGDVLVKINQ